MTGINGCIKYLLFLADSTCRTVQEEVTGCVYVGYTTDYMTSDLQCVQERTRTDNAYFLQSDKLYSGLIFTMILLIVATTIAITFCY